MSLAAIVSSIKNEKVSLGVVMSLETEDEEETVVEVML